MSNNTQKNQQSHDRLCRICSKIDFDNYLGEEITKPIPLGTWGSIQRSRRCPFCRLVVHALTSEKLLAPISDDYEIFLKNELSWKLGIELSPYDRSKSESYSNKFDLRSMVKQNPRTVYRFTVGPAANAQGEQQSLAIIQYLAHKERRPVKQQFFGRKVDPGKVPIGLLRMWLDECSKWHEGRCNRNIRSVSSLPLNMRLIDVKYRCIVRVLTAEIPEYVALSYMWGVQKMKEETGMKPAVLLRNDIKYDSKGDEHTPLQSKLPRTIEDAITLTRALGYRYLWNDALCIVQDNSFEEKAPDLINMKIIYDCSSLTIAAAAGAHADHGIAGVSVKRQYAQYSELVDGLRLATMFPSYTELESSSRLLWNTRGWTFQEKLLSRRMLLFTDYQVYLKCSESIWTEEICLESGRLSKSVESRRAKYLWDPGYKDRTTKTDWIQILSFMVPRFKTRDDWTYMGGFVDYTSAVQEYSQRQLTDANDVLFAISGILDTLEVVTGPFLLGLPRKHILGSLLWHPQVGSIQSCRAGTELPSWTWASWSFVNGTQIVQDTTAALVDSTNTVIVLLWLHLIEAEYTN
ncbi:heterokaryon incompatibility protein-domain-containing protein [Paraphoma chrysanthemicola]|nr:heterokaryon incompatibility protein-domain-containing protein [Paraphoma chrysanthemicola]